MEAYNHPDASLAGGPLHEPVAARKEWMGYSIWSLAAAILLLPAVQVINLLTVRSPEWRVFNSDFLQSLSGVVAAGLLVTVAIKFRRQRDAAAKGWQSIAVAAVFWALGMLCFMYVEVVQGKNPYPGYPDLFFLAFYPFMTLGAGWLTRGLPTPQADRINALLDLAILAVISLLAIWNFNLGHLVLRLSYQPSLDCQASLAYTLLDSLLLLTLLLVLVSRTCQGAQFLPVLFMVLGGFGLIVADLLQANTTLGTFFVSGSPTDLGWVAFSSLLALSALTQLCPQTLGGVIASSISEASKAMVAQMLGLLWMALMLGLLLSDSFLQRHPNPVFYAAGLGATFLLVMLRQIRNARENSLLCATLSQERKELELKVRDRTAELQAHADRLRESEEKLRGIVETTKEWIWAVDSQGQYLYSNPALHRMLGRPQAGPTAPSLEWLHPADRVMMQALWRDPLTRQNGWQEKQFRWLRPDGSYRILESNAIPRLDDRGQWIGFQGADRDVSERAKGMEIQRRLESQLRQSQKLEAVGQLAGGVAHDFNNLLQIIQGYTLLALQEGTTLDLCKSHLAEVQTASDRAIKLTRQLLMFSRQEAAQLEDLDMNQMVQNMLNMIRRLIGAHIEVSFVPGAQLGNVRADHSQMEQVLMNLCVNARDAMPHGGRLAVELGNLVIADNYTETHPWAKPGRYVQLAVTDTGCGMDAATQERIFEPFFTTKSKEKGTGLGLSVVYGIIQQHHGLIQVYSEPGVGTTFKIYLPEVERSASCQAKRTVRPIHTGHETILVAEDSPEIRKLTALVLEKAGYRLLLASNGAEALRIFKDNPAEIDLVYLDLIMPLIGGIEAGEQMEALKPGIKLLFCSGYSTTGAELSNRLPAGATMVEKPCAPDELLRRVHELLHR